MLWNRLAGCTGALAESKGSGSGRQRALIPRRRSSPWTSKVNGLCECGAHAMHWPFVENFLGWNSPKAISLDTLTQSLKKRFIPFQSPYNSMTNRARFVKQR
jgi:hypothetical protein